MSPITERKNQAYNATEHLISGLITQSYGETDVSCAYHANANHTPIHLESVEALASYCAHEPAEKTCQTCEKRATHGHDHPSAIPRFCKEHAPDDFIQLTCDHCPRKLMFTTPDGGGTCLIHEMEKDDHPDLTSNRCRKNCMVCGKCAHYGITKRIVCKPCSTLVETCLPGVTLKHTHGMCDECGTVQAKYTHTTTKKKVCRTCLGSGGISEYTCRFPQCTCGKVASFTATDGNENVCSTCPRDPEKTYSRLIFPCRDKKCLKIAKYGTQMGKPLACGDHKLPGEFDVAHKKCTMCLAALGPEFASQPRPKSDVCAAHRKEEHSRRVYRDKEMIVVRETRKAIERAGILIEYSRFDRRSESWDGEKQKRPDCLAVLKLGDDTLAVVLEVDEKHHERNNCDDKLLVSKLHMKDNYGITVDTPRHAYRIATDNREYPLFRVAPTYKQYQQSDYVESDYTYMDRIIKCANDVVSDIKSNFTKYVIAFKNFKNNDGTPQPLDEYVMREIRETDHLELDP